MEDKKLCKLINICKANVRGLKAYLELHLKTFGYKKVNTRKKYIFAKGNIPILLVAHTDTVHLKGPKIFWLSLDGNMLKANEGIGGDDRCGIFIITELIERGYKPYVLYCDDEEIGGIGATEFTKNTPKKNLSHIKYFLEFDRKGRYDVVRYDDDNEALTTYIESFGFKEQYGTFSDICELSPYFGISSINLSSGYYEAHTLNEYIILSELNEIIDVAEQILKDIDNVEQFKYKESPYASYYHNYYSKYYNSKKGIDWNNYEYTKYNYSYPSLNKDKSINQVTKGSPKIKESTKSKDSITSLVVYHTGESEDLKGNFKFKGSSQKVDYYEHKETDREYFIGQCDYCNEIGQLYYDNYGGSYLCFDCVHQYGLTICANCGAAVEPDIDYPICNNCELPYDEYIDFSKEKED